jgi:hypothetical protein
MKFTLYGNASEVHLGERWKVSYIDFFCVDGQAHIQRRLTWSTEHPSPQVEWGHTEKCEGSCKVWKRRNLDVSDEERELLKALQPPRKRKSGTSRAKA